MKNKNLWESLFFVDRRPDASDAAFRLSSSSHSQLPAVPLRILSEKFKNVDNVVLLGSHLALPYPLRGKIRFRSCICGFPKLPIGFGPGWHCCSNAVALLCTPLRYQPSCLWGLASIYPWSFNQETISKKKGKPSSCFYQIDLFFLLVAIWSYVI